MAPNASEGDTPYPFPSPTRSWFSVVIWTGLHAGVWAAHKAGWLVWPSSLEQDAGMKFVWWDASANSTAMRPLHVPLANEMRLHREVGGVYEDRGWFENENKQLITLLVSKQGGHRPVVGSRWAVL